MGLFDFLRRPARTTSQQPVASLTRSEPSVVSFDDESVTCRRPGGLVETVRWSDLRAVIIQTTDEGPFVDDVFWILVGETSGCVVPSEAEGMNRLLERLQRLPNFDNETLIAAMSSMENRRFLCWKRSALDEERASSR